MGYMPQNIDATSRTIGLWCLAHKDQKFITVMEAREEFPNVAANRVAAIMARYEKEGYLTRISRGFYRVIKDNVMEFERRLKPSAGEVEIVPAISTDKYHVNITLKNTHLNLNALLLVANTDLSETGFVAFLDYLDEYAKVIQGMVKYTRTNLESFPPSSESTEEDYATAQTFIKEWSE